MSKSKLFLTSILTAFLSVTMLMGGVNAYDNSQPSQKPQLAADPLASAHKLADGFYVRDQIALGDSVLKEKSSVATLIDFRPDGESPDQIPAKEVEQAARKLNIDFYYIPTPHGDIPEANVTSLLAAIDNSPMPVLMYCRSGNRAARVWALAMATKNNGPSADEIINTMKQNGYKVDDLAEQIKARVTQRTKN